MTQQGYEKLIEQRKFVKKEYEDAILWMGESAGQGGGWHENNFHEHAEEKVRYLLGKLRDINFQIEKAEIVEIKKEKSEVVVFGSTVEVEIDGEKEIFEILGEVDCHGLRPRKDVTGKTKAISTESPMGMALIGKKVGERFEVELPFGKSGGTVVKLI